MSKTVGEVRVSLQDVEERLLGIEGIDVEMVDRRELARAMHGDRVLLLVSLLLGDLFPGSGRGSWPLWAVPEREVLEAHLGRFEVPDRIVPRMVQGQAPGTKTTFAEETGQ